MCCWFNHNNENDNDNNFIKNDNDDIILITMIKIIEMTLNNNVNGKNNDTHNNCEDGDNNIITYCPWPASIDNWY